MTTTTAPCIVGVAQLTEREPGREPLDLWAEATGLALHDAGGRGLGDAIDDLTVVAATSWRYDDPAGRLAERLGLRPGRRQESLLAGTAPQRALDAAAERLLRGESTVALVVGGESSATRRALHQRGEQPAWGHPAADQGVPMDPDWFLPTEAAHGVIPATTAFALLASAQRAHAGRTPEEDLLRLARISAAGSVVAAGHPCAWFPTERTVEEIVTVTSRNRAVAEPFTKLMCAFPDVDMASATLLTMVEVAARHGVPDDRRVFLAGWGFARDAAHVAGRPAVGTSPAATAAVTSALDAAGTHLDDVDLIDLYGCFPSATALVADAIGLEVDDPRGLTVLGGLASFGGPLGNTMGHSVATIADLLRSGRHQRALTTGIGLHAVKHVAAVYSSEPCPAPEVAPDVLEAGATDVPVAEQGDGRATVLAHTVVVERDGSERLVVVAELADGRRCYAAADDPSLVGAAHGADLVGHEVLVRAKDRTNVVLDVEDRR